MQVLQQTLILIICFESSRQQGSGIGF